MAFTRNDVKSLREELQAVMDKYAAEHGIQVTFGNASYDDLEINFKVKVVSASVDNSKENWVKNCKYVGLAPEDYGKTIVINGDQFAVCGLKNGARKNIIEVQKLSSGTKYVISRETFLRCGGTDGFEARKVTVV